MRWFDFGEEAHGVVAIGQFATGVVAVGQFAHGVVAIGQFAFGVVAFGQVAVGGVTVGLVGAGMYFTVAMLGVGGRGVGFVLPLLPALGGRIPPGQTVKLAALGERPDGWVRLHLEPRPDGRIALFEDSERLCEVRLDARVRRAGLSIAPGDAWAQLRRSPDGFVAERLVRIDPPRWREPRWWLVWGAQLAGLTLLGAAVWWAVIGPLGAAWFGPEGILVP